MKTWLLTWGMTWLENFYTVLQKSGYFFFLPTVQFTISWQRARLSGHARGFGISEARLWADQRLTAATHRGKVKKGKCRGLIVLFFHALTVCVCVCRSNPFIRHQKLTLCRYSTEAWWRSLWKAINKRRGLLVWQHLFTMWVRFHKCEYWFRNFTEKSPFFPPYVCLSLFLLGIIIYSQ